MPYQNNWWKDIFSALFVPVDEAKDAVPVTEIKAMEVVDIVAIPVKPITPSDCSLGKMSTEDLWLIWGIKEAETRNKKLQVQALRLPVRALEL